MKTQITDWLFVFNTIRQKIDKGLSVDLKIFYFSLEMTKEEKMLAAFSNILYLEEGIRISPKDLKSTKQDNILSEEELNIISKYEEYFRIIEETVVFIDDIRHPTGIYKVLTKYAQDNGTSYYKTIKTDDGDKKSFDYYIPDNPDEYVMCIIDHISLISPESQNGTKLNLRDSITLLSSKYLIRLRNMYNYIPVVVQQQSSAQESVDNAKANKLKPTLDGLGEAKTTQRDANLILGLFSPFRHEIPTYYKYDITQFRDNIRFLEILGGREGGAGTICPLYFDGAVNYFKELPLPTDKDSINSILTLLNQKIRKNVRKPIQRRKS